MPRRAGLIRSFLTGRGPDAIPAAQRIITPKGGLDFAAIERVSPPLKGLSHKVSRGILGYLFGVKPLTVYQQRIRQGGMFGPGGVIGGSLALSKDVADAYAQGGARNAFLRHPIAFPAEVAERALLVGAPLYAAQKAMQNDDVGGALREGLRGGAYVAAGPFGLVGSKAVYKATGLIPGALDQIIPRIRESQGRSLRPYSDPQNFVFPQELYRS